MAGFVQIRNPLSRSVCARCDIDPVVRSPARVGEPHVTISKHQGDSLGTMPILALAARHHAVGLEALERLSALRGADVAPCPGVRGLVVLSTCNRVELYADVATATAAAAATTTAATTSAAVMNSVATSLDLPISDVTAAFELVPDPAVHLCEVAAGLDSMVLGEREIAGQVRRAIAGARADGTSSGALERLFAAASRAARRVSNETELGALGRSLVDVALDAAGMRAGARCVLVGTGSYAGASAAALLRRGAARVDVYSPSGRATAFAAQRGLGTVAADALPAALAAADLVVTCSGRPDVVLGPGHFDPGHAGQSHFDRRLVDQEPLDPEHFASEADDVADARPRRPPLVVVDLALGRDVDPAVGELPHVRLVSLRNLAGAATSWAGDHASAPPTRGTDDSASLTWTRGTGDPAGPPPIPGADDVARARAIATEVAGDLVQADRAVAWGRDLAAIRRRALAAHPPHARRQTHARLHRASVLATDAARSGDRRRFDAALVELEAVADLADLADLA